MADSAECARQKMATACRIQDAHVHAHDTTDTSSSSQQRRLKRARAAPVVSPPLPPLCVEYRVALDGMICVALVTHLVQFLLYFRGQIPCVYDELLGIVLEYQEQEQQALQQSPSGPGRRRKVLSGAMKKAIKCMTTTERLFQTSLNALFEGSVHSVVLIFGASVFSPREVFVVDFLNGDESTSGGSDSKLPKEKVVRLCAQKLIRTLIASSTQRFTSGLTVTSLHIAALAEKRASGIPGFVPKQSFRLRLPRSKQANSRTYHFCISGGNTLSSSPVLVGNPPSSQDARQSATEMQENGDNRSQLYEKQEPEPWFRQKIPVLDPSLIWYTFDNPIAGFAGAL